MQNNTQFGFKQVPSNRTRTRQPQVQQQPVYVDETQVEQDPKWEVKAYLKIKLPITQVLRDGTEQTIYRSLKVNGKDIPLREGSKLEAMLLSFWQSGRDLNELREILELDVVSAIPDAEVEEEKFDFSSILTQAEKPIESKPKPKPRNQGKTRKPTSDEPLDDDHPY